ncbi:MAG: alpha/beta fold hydrolase [Spirochaetota bacterium]
MELMKGWEPFSYTKKSDVGVLVLQGYTGSTSSVRPLGDYLGKFYNVEGPRLSGHGTRWQDLNRVHWEDWVADAETALALLKRRAKRIFIAGLSMGGTISLYLAERHREINGIVLVNHLLILKNPLLPILPILKLIVPAVKAIASDMMDPTQKEIGYDHTPLKGLAETMKMASIVKRGLADIRKPILIFKSKDDHVVPVDGAPYTYERVSSRDKELVWLTNSRHVATMDYDKTIIMERTRGFIERVG